MKTLVVVSSYHHNNTEKIARVMADVLGAEMKTPREVKPEEPAKYDLVGFGAGIDSGRHYQPLLDLADALPMTVGGKAFIFSTNGAPAGLTEREREGVDRNHDALRKIILAKGYTVVGEFSCPGFNTNSFLKLFGGLNKSRPDTDDLRRAERFAREAAAPAAGRA